MSSAWFCAWNSFNRSGKRSSILCTCYSFGAKCAQGFDWFAALGCAESMSPGARAASDSGRGNQAITFRYLFGYRMADSHGQAEDRSRMLNDSHLLTNKDKGDSSPPSAFLRGRFGSSHAM